jgi:hydrogenase 3 maturation protease
MENVFKDILKGKVVIVGVGNTLKRDDGLGCVLTRRLQGKTKAVCIDAGAAPENFTGIVRKEDPDTVIIIDAADLGREPGAFAILDKDEIMTIGFTTHDISPPMLMEYLETQTRASIYMLGIQPERVEFGEGLSDRIEETLKKVEALISHA